MGEMAVKHIPMVAKRKPAKKAKGMIKSDEGSSIRPKAATTASMIDALIKLRVAPHSNSPVITSSILNGVAIMASKVF